MNKVELTTEEDKFVGDRDWKGYHNTGVDDSHAIKLGKIYRSIYRDRVIEYAIWITEIEYVRIGTVLWNLKLVFKGDRYGKSLLKRFEDTLAMLHVGRRLETERNRRGRRRARGRMLKSIHNEDSDEETEPKLKKISAKTIKKYINDGKFPLLLDHIKLVGGYDMTYHGKKIDDRLKWILEDSGFKIHTDMKYILANYSYEDKLKYFNGLKQDRQLTFIKNDKSDFLKRYMNEEKVKRSFINKVYRMVIKNRLVYLFPCMVRHGCRVRVNDLKNILSKMRSKGRYTSWGWRRWSRWSIFAKESKRLSSIISNDLENILDVLDEKKIEYDKDMIVDMVFNNSILYNYRTHDVSISACRILCRLHPFSTRVCDTNMMQYISAIVERDGNLPMLKELIDKKIVMIEDLHKDPSIMSTAIQSLSINIVKYLHSLKVRCEVDILELYTVSIVAKGKDLSRFIEESNPRLRKILERIGNEKIDILRDEYIDEIFDVLDTIEFPITNDILFDLVKMNGGIRSRRSVAKRHLTYIIDKIIDTYGIVPSKRCAKFLCTNSRGIKKYGKYFKIDDRFILSLINKQHYWYGVDDEFIRAVGLAKRRKISDDKIIKRVVRLKNERLIHQLVEMGFKPDNKSVLDVILRQGYSYNSKEIVNLFEYVMENEPSEDDIKRLRDNFMDICEFIVENIRDTHCLSEKYDGYSLDNYVCEDNMLIHISMDAIIVKCKLLGIDDTLMYVNTINLGGMYGEYLTFDMSVDDVFYMALNRFYRDNNYSDKDILDHLRNYPDAMSYFVLKDMVKCGVGDLQSTFNYLVYKIMNMGFVFKDSEGVIDTLESFLKRGAKISAYTWKMIVTRMNNNAAFRSQFIDMFRYICGKIEDYGEMFESDVDIFKDIVTRRIFLDRVSNGTIQFKMIKRIKKIIKDLRVGELIDKYVEKVPDAGFQVNPDEFNRQLTDYYIGWDAKYTRNRDGEDEIDLLVADFEKGDMENINDDDFMIDDVGDIDNIDNIDNVDNVSDTDEELIPVKVHN